MRREKNGTTNAERQTRITEADAVLRAGASDQKVQVRPSGGTEMAVLIDTREDPERWDGMS